MTHTRDLNEANFRRLVSELQEPPTLETLRRRTHSSQRRHRTAAGLAALMGVVGLVVGVTQLHTTAATRVIYSANPGSTGMPTTFVAADPSGNVFLFDSSSGNVIRQLYTHSGQFGFGGLTADAQDVFISDEHGIHEVPRSGGPATLISAQSATVMAVNSDGTTLAWSTASPLAGMSEVKPVITVNVMNLRDRSTRHWTVTSPASSISPPGAQAAYDASAYHIFQLGWTSPNQIAAVISSEQVSGGSQELCTHPLASTVTTCTETSQPSTAPADPTLLTFNSATGSMSSQLDIPTPDAGWLDAGSHYLGAGPNPGTIVTTISPGEGAPSRLVELTVHGSTVTIRTLLQLPGPQYLPQSLDADGHDLLVSAPSGGAWTFLRLTDQRPPTPVTRDHKWSAYASW